jgi:hypothetical protein
MVISLGTIKVKMKVKGEEIDFDLKFILEWPQILSLLLLHLFILTSIFAAYYVSDSFWIRKKLQKVGK